MKNIRNYRTDGFDVKDGQVLIGQIEKERTQMSSPKNPHNNNPSNTSQLIPISHLRPLKRSKKSPRQKHTGHKLLLSVSNKFIPKLTTLKLKKAVKKIVSSLNKSYDQGTFAKHIILAKKLDIFEVFKKEIPNLFRERIKKMIGNQRQERINETITWKEKFVKCLEVQLIEEQVNIIWDSHKQPNKFKNSFESVLTFKKSQQILDLDTQN